MKLKTKQELKGLEEKALLMKVKDLKSAINELILDKNMGKMKDAKSINKKKKEVAVMLTIANQKRMLSVVESVKSVKSEGGTK